MVQTRLMAKRAKQAEAESKKVPTTKKNKNVAKNIKKALTESKKRLKKKSIKDPEKWFILKDDSGLDLINSRGSKLYLCSKKGNDGYFREVKKKGDHNVCSSKFRGRYIFAGKAIKMPEKK